MMIRRSAELDQRQPTRETEIEMRLAWIDEEKARERTERQRLYDIVHPPPTVIIAGLRSQERVRRMAIHKKAAGTFGPDLKAGIPA